MFIMVKEYVIVVIRESGLTIIELELELSKISVFQCDFIKLCGS